MNNMLQGCAKYARLQLAFECVATYMYLIYTVTHNINLLWTKNFN